MDLAMADSEGTWVLGVISGDDFAATDFGQHSPTAAEDTWAAAGTSVQPVFERACVRLARQLAKVCAGELPLSNGIMLGESKLLEPGNNAAELALAGERVRRPLEYRVIYDGGTTVGPNYLNLASGYGSADTPGLQSLGMSGSVPMRLRSIVINVASGLPGLTTLSLRDDTDTAIAEMDFDLAAGVNEVDFLTGAGAHSISAGALIMFTLESAAGQDGMGMLLQFEEVPL